MSRRLCGPLALLALAVATQAGCAPGVAWRNYVYEPVRADAARDGKPILVYFRHWAFVECTKFEEAVLKDQRVLAATRDFYCVALQIDWDRALAEKWGISDPPGVVLLSPDERVLAHLSGQISVDRLLTSLNYARNPSGSASQPAPGRPKPK